MLTADQVLGAVRIHADRVHDAVRRLGCGPDAAVEVVERSALELIDVARVPGTVTDPVGWWFARARNLGRSLAGDDDALPVGGGVLGGDANQVRLAEALESLPELERAALLLRDSYDLPASAVGTALGLDADAAMEVVGAARLDFLPALLGGAPLVQADHVAERGALARLGEGGQVAGRDATARRHAQSCERCGDVLDAQERARRLLSGLTVVALPDAFREGLLSRVQARAEQVLPAPTPEAEAGEYWEDEEPHRRYSLSLIALALVLSSGLGIGIGLLASRDKGPGSLSATEGRLPLVTAAPALSLAPAPATPTATASPTVSPTPRVFIITPSPTPPPTATATLGTAGPTISQEPLSLLLHPSTGPNDSEITVDGAGWLPGATVHLAYLERFTGNPGSSVDAVVDERGRFTAVLTAHDPQALPGAHTVTAEDGTNSTTAEFTATA